MSGRRRGSAAPACSPASPCSWPWPWPRRPSPDSGTASVEAEKAADAPVTNNHCTTARGNLALLEGDGPVGTDTDKDGKPDTAFTAAERSAQKELAKAAINVHCSDAAAVPSSNPTT